MPVSARLAKSCSWYIPDSQAQDAICAPETVDSAPKAVITDRFLYSFASSPQVFTHYALKNHGTFSRYYLLRNLHAPSLHSHSLRQK